MYTKTANRVHIHNLPQEAAPKIGVASFLFLCIYFSRSITRLLASSIFRLLNLMYMSVTVAML